MFDTITKSAKFSLGYLFLLSFLSQAVYSQNVLEFYHEIKKDSIRIGKGEKDFFPLIQKGYTIMLPESKVINGVLIFFEDSGYDNKNKSAKQIYTLASEKAYAVLSVSTEIPFDFYFSKESLSTSNNLLEEVFEEYDLPNKNIFFLGAGLIGHRAMKYIQWVKHNTIENDLTVQGLVICNFTLDWTRKWNQHERDIRINRIDLWEPTFINYMLETHLEGTPETAPNSYHEFSAYSYSDKENRNIKLFQELSIRAYVEPAIEYRLREYHRTLYENNATDFVGFIAELHLSGNTQSELIILNPEDNDSRKPNGQSSWDSIDKDDLMKWIVNHSVE